MQRLQRLKALVDATFLTYSALRETALYALHDARLPWWPASLDGKHHCHAGGLLRHIEEVATIGLSMIGCNEALGLPVVDRQHFLVAVLFHDFGKLWDYEPVFSEGVGFDGRGSIVGWKASRHKRRTHHISRSNMEWSNIAAVRGVTPEVFDEISHAILAHHGRREWGSPVAPDTALAWILHLSDSASARQDEIARGVDHLQQRQSNQ